MDGPSCQRDKPGLVGDPVDTLTGAVVDRSLDFRLTGPIELRWTRHYDSSQSHRVLSAGRGWAHEFDRSLSLDGGGIIYDEPLRRQVRFPALHDDGEECALHGFKLRRFSAECYHVLTHAEPAMEFVFRPPARRARLTRLLQTSAEVKFRYDAAQRLIGIQDSAGRRLTAEENAGCLVRLAVEPTSTNPGFLLIAYHYDEDSNLVGTENEQGHGYSYAYDEANRLVLRRGRKGFQFYFKYDAQGRCIRSMGDDRLYGVVLDYAVPGRITKVTRPDRGVWTYMFTARAELSEIHDPLGGVQKFVRDPTGRQALQIDPNGNATKFVYDAAGAPIAKIDPLGHRITLPEDPNAPVPLANRVAANAAEYEYGRLLDVEKIRLPGQAVVRELPLSFEARSLIFTRSEENAPLEQPFEVPPLRVLWWPKPKAGRVFNDLGKLLEQRDDLGRRRRWAYDESGNVAEYIDFDGGRWLYDYPGWHFLRALTNPLGHEVRFTYTPYGEVTSFTDAGGTLSEYRYDLKDRLVEIRRHGVVRETYTRDAVGNLIAKHASDGRELLRFEIGPGNLRLRRTLASGDEHTFQYDKSGRPLLAETKKDRVEFAYDAMGNCVLEKRNGLGLEQRFQGWRRPAESVFFERFTVRYEWRDDTLLITDSAGKSHAIQFLRHGLVERRFSNGSREISQHDSLGRCLFKHAERASGRPWTRRYHWSGEGELRRVKDNRHGEARHEYDAAHRLRRRYTNARVEDYEFDRADNLVAQPSLSNVTLYEGNRLKSANGSSFIYNDRNHIEVRQTARGTIRYGYDSRDQLVLVETPDGDWSADYDAVGRRTRKMFAGRTTEYYWNGDQLVAEMQSDGRLRLYVYADPLALVPLLFLDYESPDAPPESGKRRVIFTNQIGTPCLVEDDEGTDVWIADIAPFGRIEVEPEFKIELNFRFPGHYLDPELGLNYNRFRYYDPTLGRYLQSDPWGIAGGTNVYGYHVNPLLVVDVRGLGEDGDPKRSRAEDDEEGLRPPGGGEDEPDRPRLTREQGQEVVDAMHGALRPEDQRQNTTGLTQLEDGRVVLTSNDTTNGVTPTQREVARDRLGAMGIDPNDVSAPNERRLPNGEPSPGFVPKADRDLPDAPNPDRAGDAEQRGIQAGQRMGSPATNQWASRPACEDCATAQRENNVRNETGFAPPNGTGRYDQGGTEPPWNPPGA